MESNVTLRPPIETDIALFFEHMQDREAQQMAAFTSDDPSDRDAHNAHWARIMANERIMIRTIEVSSVVAGYIASFYRGEELEVTYWIDRLYWGKSVTTKALRLFLDNQTDRPMYARVAFDNVASVRVLEKCGFNESRRERGYANARACEIEELVMKLA